MASEKEKVAEIVKDMRDEFPPKYCSSKHCRVEVHQPVRSFADRIEAAHKREIDAKDAEESERLSRIYNIVMDSNEENWRDCMSRIEAITREVI